MAISVKRLGKKDEKPVIKRVTSSITLLRASCTRASRRRHVVVGRLCA